MQTPAPKKRVPTYPNDSILESIRDLGSGVGKSVAHDLVGKVGSDALGSLVGSSNRSSGELRPNESLRFGKEDRQQSTPPVRAELQPRMATVRAEEQRIKQQLEAVRLELKALSGSIKGFNQEIERAITSAPVEPGIYHLNFFERLKSLLTVLRQQIEDSRSWLALWTARKKKVAYWGLYKKHGTKFGLSAERTLATSAG